VVDISIEISADMVDFLFVFLAEKLPVSTKYPYVYVRTYTYKQRPNSGNVYSEAWLHVYVFVGMSRY
jgi:hypothetical protein